MVCEGNSPLNVKALQTSEPVVDVVTDLEPRAPEAWAPAEG